MIGAIAGDIIGSVYEAHPIKTSDFPLFDAHCRFTDDSVLTVAVAQAIMEDGDYGRWVREIGRRYPNAGYGGAFFSWLHSGLPRPYNSWGNGAAMRVSPVGWAYDTVDSVLGEAARSAASRIITLKGSRGRRWRLWPFSWPERRGTRNGFKGK